MNKEILKYASDIAKYNGSTYTKDDQTYWLMDLPSWWNAVFIFTRSGRTPKFAAMEKGEVKSYTYYPEDCIGYVYFEGKQMGRVHLSHYPTAVDELHIMRNLLIDIKDGRNQEVNETYWDVYEQVCLQARNAKAIEQQILQGYDQAIEHGWHTYDENGDSE